MVCAFAKNNNKCCYRIFYSHCFNRHVQTDSSDSAYIEATDDVSDYDCEGRIDVSMDDFPYDDYEDECNESIDNSFEDEYSTNNLSCSDFDDDEDEELLDDNLLMQSAIEDHDRGLREEDDGFTLDLDDVIPMSDCIPTTDSAEQAVTVQQQSVKGKYISGHVILNQCGSLLTRNNHRIVGYSNQKSFLERIVSTSGNNIPLLYPLAMLFPSIYYHSIDTDGSMTGAIPASMLTGSKHNHGFASIDKQIRNYLTFMSSTTSSSPSFISFAFDILTNAVACQQHSRVVIRRGLVADSSQKFGLTVKSKQQSSLRHTWDSRQLIRFLNCTTKHHAMDLYFTFTMNALLHFGVSKLREWINSKGWTKHYPNWDKLQDFEQEEVVDCFEQSGLQPILRNWLETRELFLSYIMNAEHSPFGECGAFFARDEYQSDSGNVPHIHGIMQVKKGTRTNEQQREFLYGLVKGSVCEMITKDEVDKMIKEGVMNESNLQEDIDELSELACSFQNHSCSQRCLKRVKKEDGSESFECRKMNNHKLTKDNTSDYLRPLPVKLSNDCKKALVAVKIMDPITINEDGFPSKPVFHHNFFTPSRHIPITNPNEKLNISPCNPIMFAATKSQQNLQVIGTKGMINYINKYISKLDEQNRVIINAHPHKNNGIRIECEFLHNTKIGTSAINEKKNFEMKRNRSHPTGKSMATTEMLHLSLGETEVHMNMNYVRVSTMPLELRPGVETIKGRRSNRALNEDNNNRNNRGNNVAAGMIDGATTGSEINRIRRAKSLPLARQMRHHELFVLQGTSQCSISIDRVTKFSLRPPELRRLFDKLLDYYRWFEIDKAVMSSKEMEDNLSCNIRKSVWVDGLHHQVRIRVKALPEVLEHLQSRSDHDDIVEAVDKELVIFINEINDVVEKGRAIAIGREIETMENSLEFETLSEHYDKYVTLRRKQNDKDAERKSQENDKDAERKRKKKENDEDVELEFLKGRFNKYQTYKNHKKEYSKLKSYDDNELTQVECELYNFAMDQLLHVDEDQFCPIIVSNEVTPDNAHQFILHILLTLGRFETEVDLTTHRSLRDSFRYAKLIGSNNDEESLMVYANKLLLMYIVEQVVEYSFSFKRIDKIIVDAHRLFHDVIVKNEIPIKDMPQTSLQAIDLKQKKELELFWKTSKEEIINTAFYELGMFYC